MKPIGFIYKTTCLVNGKIYIGQHEFNANKRFNATYLGSGVIFLKAVKKYRRSNFKRKILKLCETHHEMNIWEHVYIVKYKSTDPKIGYNIVRGDVNNQGNPAKLPEVREKIRRKLTGAGNPNFQKKWSESKRRQMIKMFRENHPMKGKKHSKDTKKHWSDIRKGKDPFANLTAEEKEGIRKKFIGKNNPMYGSKFFWINNGKINKRNDINSEIPKGWIKGYIRYEKNKDKNNF